MRSVRGRKIILTDLFVDCRDKNHTTIVILQSSVSARNAGTYRIR